MQQPGCRGLRQQPRRQRRRRSRHRRLDRLRGLQPVPVRGLRQQLGIAHAAGTAGARQQDVRRIRPVRGRLPDAGLRHGDDPRHVLCADRLARRLGRPGRQRLVLRAVPRRVRQRDRQLGARPGDAAGPQQRDRVDVPRDRRLRADGHPQAVDNDGYADNLSFVLQAPPAGDVPEPGMAAVFALGLGMLGWSRRSKRPTVPQHGRGEVEPQPQAGQGEQQAGD